MRKRKAITRLCTNNFMILITVLKLYAEQNKLQGNTIYLNLSVWLRLIDLRC